MKENKKPLGSGLYRVRDAQDVEEIANLKEKLATMREIVLNDRLSYQKAIDDIAGKKNVVLSCAYCGLEYPSDTPASQGYALYQHLRSCEKHPMKELLDFVKYIKAHISNTINSGLVWVNVTPEMVLEKCEKLLG